MNLLNRAFGLQFRGQLLEGSAYQVDNRIEVHFFFNGNEYEDTQKFNLANNITQEEANYLNSEINKLLSRQ